MKKNLKIFKKYQLYIVSFLLSFFVMTFLYALLRIYPFGSKTILTMDMSGQYVNYLAYFRSIMLNQASLFYNFSMNLGSNCYGLFAYYLSSPLNIILCFFRENHITEAILVLNIIKIALCSTTMTIFLSKTKKIKSIYVLILSLMYAFMSYNIVYSQNIMWLDGGIYLPLVILGLEKVLKKESNLLYIISLFLCIISNFYVGYMVGVFSVFYVVIRFFQVYDVKSMRDIFQKHKSIIWSYVKSTVLILFLSMIILLPVFLNLLASKSEIDTSGFLFELYYSPFDIFSKLAIGAFDQSQLAFGPPNIYCGSLCLILVLLYFVNSKFSIKERLLDLLLVVILILCFWIIPFNLFFHMLQTPVWFPFRNSFVFSFLIIIITSKYMEKQKIVSFESILKVAACLVFLFMVLHKFSYSYLSTKSILFTILFVLAVGIIYYFSEQKKSYTLLLLCVVSLELLFNGYRILKQLDYVERDCFLASYRQASELVSKYKSDVHSFYRIENKISRSINDPMLHNYNGFYHYSSLSGKDNKNFLSNFGIRHNLIMENASDTTLPMASLLGIRYYMSSSSKDRSVNLYQKLKKNVYQNPYALNLGFLVSDKVKNIKLNHQPLENQNALLQSFSSESGEIFEEVLLNNKKKIYKDPGEEWYLVYSISTDNRNGLKVYLDDKLYKNTSEVTDQEKNVIYIPKGIKNIRIKCDSKYQLKAYRYYNERFEEIYREISQNQLMVEENKEHYIKGKIDVKKAGVLLTSIIDNDGWSVKVDGKKVEKQVVAGNLLAIDLKKGNHTIEFSYVPKGFFVGLFLFAVGLFFVIVEVLENRNCLHKQMRRKK